MAYYYAWGAWKFASWYCGTSCYHSTYKPTVHGHNIHGDVLASACNASGVCNWRILTQDTTTGTSTALNVNAQGAYVWANGGVLESYGINRCTDYPSSPTYFRNIDVYDRYGHLQAPGWANYVSFTGCGQAITSSTYAVSLYY